MAFKKKNIYDIIGAAVVLSALLSTASAVDCLGKSFHCVNSSHFMICVDVGGGVSQSIADFTIPCPPPTVCQGNNHFECEFPVMTTSPTTLSNVISESTMTWEEVDVTTVLPHQNTTKEYSEKYMNTESLTSFSANSYTTDGIVDYTTEASSLIDSVIITETRPAVTETLLFDTTTSKNDITQTITEHNEAFGGELSKETANNYTLGQEVTTDKDLVSASTIKAIPSKLNATEANSLIDGVSMTQTETTVTEAFPIDTTTIQNVITQTITEDNEASPGEFLAETANNYTLVSKVTDDAGLVYTTEKAVSSKLHTTESASLIDDISVSPSRTELLPYDILTSQDVITQTITERNVASAVESLTETANNYTLEQEVTTNEGLVSTSTIKPITSKLNTTEASLIDDRSVTENGAVVTEVLPEDTPTNQYVITKTITKQNEASAGVLLAETANNYTFEHKVTDDAGFVYTSTIKALPSKLNTSESTSIIDDISLTETSPAVTEALLYDTTTSQNVVTQTITERNVESARETLTETANNYTLEQKVKDGSGLVYTSTEKAVPSKLNSTEAASLIDDISITETVTTVTEAHDSTSSKGVITQTINDHILAAAGGLSTESAVRLVQKITTDEGLVSPSTETTTKMTRDSAFNQVKTTSESIPTDIGVFNKLPTTTDNVFGTDVNRISTDLRVSHTNILDYGPTTESELATVDIITADVNLFTTEQLAAADLLQTTLITNSLNYATTTSESTTAENVVFNKRNLTVFEKDALTDTNANSGIEISLGQEQNVTNNKPLSPKNISSVSSTEQIMADMFNNSISTDVPSILTTGTVYLITNDKGTTNNDEVLDQTKQTSNSMVTEAIVGTELPTIGYKIIPDAPTVPSVDLVRNAGNQNMFNYVTPNATTMVDEKIRTERPNITLFKENTVTEAITNLETESPLFLKQNLTDNAPVHQTPIDNTSSGSSSTKPAVIPTLDTGHSINPDNFARGTEIVTTEETRYNVVDQATLGTDLIAAVTELPTVIDDNFTTENNIVKDDEVPSAENRLFNTNMSNHTINCETKTLILENNIGVEQQKITTNNGHLTEAPPQIFATNANDNKLNPNIVEQAPSTSNINVEENLATAVVDNLTAKKNTIVPVNNLGNSPKHLEFDKYNTEHPKPIVIDNNLLSDTDVRYITITSNTENKINSSLSDDLGKSSEKSAVLHNVTKQLTINDIQGSITTDTALETGQVKNTQKHNPVKDSVVSSAQQIFDKTGDVGVETGTILENTFDNNSHTITSITKQINKVEVADNYHLDLAADGITKEPNYFIHGVTTNSPFIVTTALAAGVDKYNKIEDQVSNLEVTLDTIRPTDVSSNSLHPISNIISNKNMQQSDVNKVESTTEANIALTSELIQEKNLNPIGIQAKEYIQKVVDSFGMKETTESNLKESKTSFYATVATDKPNDGALPVKTKSVDSGKTTKLYTHEIKPELIDHKDFITAEETKQSNTNLAPTTSINDKNKGTLNYDQFNFLTDSSLNDNTKNKTDLDGNKAAKTKNHTSTLNATNANENKNDLLGLIINITDNTILKAQEGSKNYFKTSFQSDVSESEKVSNYNTLQSGTNVQDPQYHYFPTETYIRLDVDNYPKLTIMEESFSHVASTQISSQNNYFTTTSSIVTNDANIITEKTTSINGVDLNEVSVVKDNIYLPQLDTTLQRPAISSVITDTQKSITGNQDDDSLTTKVSTKFATAGVNEASTKNGNQAIDLIEKTIGNTEATATMSSQVVTKFETLTVYIRDADQNKIDEVPSDLQTRNSKPYLATSTSGTINAPNPANEAQDINNVLITGKPIILVFRNKSTDNPLTQPQVVKEIRADVNEINTSSSVIANSEQSHVNVSQKIGTITETLLSQNHTNATEVAKTERNATSSYKVFNTINSTTQAPVKRVVLRPVSPQLMYNCINGTRGRYSDKNDCRKFYICLGNNQPIVGICPVNTVFSDIKKLCTRNMSHCIRENQFKCPLAGRFSDLINDIYYICINHKNKLYRFKFQCQKGFSLNRTITRCMENKVIVSNDSVFISSSDRSGSSTVSSTSKSRSSSSINSGSRGDSDNSNSSQSRKSEEKKETEKEDLEKPENKEEDESDEIFVCRKEGKFPIRNECRRYYLCKKNGKSKYRRKIKKCGSGDVFHKNKKMCVDAESYEC